MQKRQYYQENRQSSLLGFNPIFKDDTDLYRNVISKHFSALVACITDTMHLLGITFILYLLKSLAGNGLSIIIPFFN